MPPARPGLPFLRTNLALVASLGASTAILWVISGRLLSNTAPWVGHDYSYFFPYLVAGSGWIRDHGWTPPYFTPDFCGGIPWLANPQSLFYSVPQWLATVTGPISAARWTLITFATIGASATFWLLRRGFRASTEAAALGFVLFQLNGFLIFRMAVGHLPFHVFGLAPLLAMLVLWPAGARRLELRVVAIAALCLAAMVFGGGVVLVVPVALATAAVIAIAQSRSGVDPRPWARLGAAIAWSLPLTAVKLVPGIVLIREFPRVAPPALVPTFGAYLIQLGRSLALPESLAPFTPLGGSSVNQHEFEFGVSLIPPLLLAVLLLRWVRHPTRPRHVTPVAILVAIAALVTGLSMGTPRWAVMLHHVPIVSSFSIGTRWWVVWVVILIVGGSLALDAVGTTRIHRVALLGACTAVVCLQAVLRPLTRYTEPTTFSVYDPAPATRAAVRINADLPLPQISAIARPIAERRSDGVIPWAANDGVFDGKSDVPCYEPMFEHDLRLFPAVLLVAGPVMELQPPAMLNLADPRCYFPAGSPGCQPGDRFQAGDSAAARRFVAHDALEWREPIWQRLSGWTTVASVAVTLVVLIASCLLPARRA